MTAGEAGIGGDAGAGGAWQAILRGLARVGHATRQSTRFLLAMVGGAFGVLREACRPSAWRRTTRAEFRAALRQAAGGGVVATLFTAILVGIAAIAQALYWLGIAGLIQSTSDVIVNALLRELAPILVGIILLGRSGMPMTAELGRLAATGHLRTLEAQGLDSFILIVLPRSLALSVSSFTLGVLFVLAALLASYATGVAEGVVTSTLWSYLSHVATAISGRDYAAVPVEMLLVGFLVGLSSCLTGLAATDEAEVLALLSRGFARGILTVIAVCIVFAVFV